LRKSLPRSGTFRALALAIPVAAVLFVVVGPGLAGAETAPTPTGTTAVIHIEEVKGALKFVAPPTVTAGDQLEIVNETNPKKVGPHTFSLVTKGSLPKTVGARKNCFTPNHICLSIAKWQGVKGENSPPTINPSKAGAEGWSTMGTLKKTGDSWFTGVKPGAKFSQIVSSTPQTIYFMCAIHPWMQGKITVLPGPTS
jgi:hypothetical protein